VRRVAGVWRRGAHGHTLCGYHFFEHFFCRYFTLPRQRIYNLVLDFTYNASSRIIMQTSCWIFNLVGVRLFDEAPL
jgi:hypothetical protein